MASLSSGNTLSSLQALPQADFLLGGLPSPGDSWSPFIGASLCSPLCLFTALLPLRIILFLCVLVCGPPPRSGLGAPGAGTPSVLAVCIPSSARGSLCVAGVCSPLEEGMVNERLRTLPGPETFSVPAPQGFSALSPEYMCGWHCPYPPAGDCSSLGAVFSVWPPGKGFLSKEALFTFLTGNPQQIISVHT